MYRIVFIHLDSYMLLSQVSKHLNPRQVAAIDAALAAFSLQGVPCLLVNYSMCVREANRSVDVELFVYITVS